MTFGPYSGRSQSVSACLALALVVTACSEDKTSFSPGGAGGGGQGGVSAGDSSVATDTTSGGVGGAAGTSTGTTNWVETVFGCKFAWGAPYNWDNPNVSYLSFVSTWMGQEVNAGLSSWSGDASVTNSGDQSSTCWACAVVESAAATSAVPVFYTYVIGQQACNQSGFCDCNTDSDGHTLCTDGAQFIRDNRAQIINAYAQYAKAVAATAPNEPVLWWLEGDYVQYTGTTQTNPLDFTEAGQLIRDITTAIKTNQPNALVGVNHSPWNSDGVSQQFWTNMPVDILDFAWVAGAGDTDQYPNSGDYNAATATYAWLHEKTGLPIMAETNGVGENRWLQATAAQINERIESGVVAVLLNNPTWSDATGFASATSAFTSLNSTCN